MATRVALLLTAVLIAAILLARASTLSGYGYGWRDQRGGNIWQDYGRRCGWECGAIAGLGGAARIGGLYQYPYYPPTEASTTETSSRDRTRS